MRIEDVRYVLAVAEEANLTKAATRMHVSPPTMSEAIKRLEASLAVNLFDRSNRGMTVNAAGERLLPYLRRISEAASDLEHATARDPSTDRTIRVGTVLGWGSAVLQDLIENPPVRFDGSEINVQMSVHDWTDPTAGLRAGTSDVAILAGPTGFDAELVSVQLAAEPRCVVMSRSKRAAAKQTVSLQEVDDMGWVPFNSTDPEWSAFMYADHDRGGPAPFVNRPPCRTPEDAALAVHNGHGVIVTILDVARHFSVGDVVFRPVPDVSPIPMRVAHRKSPVNDDVRQLSAILCSRLPPAEGQTAFWTYRSD